MTGYRHCELGRTVLNTCIPTRPLIHRTSRELNLERCERFQWFVYVLWTRVKFSWCDVNKALRPCSVILECFRLSFVTHVDASWTGNVANSSDMFPLLHYRGHFNDQVKLSVGRLCLDDLSNEMTFDVDACLWRGGSSWPYINLSRVRRKMFIFGRKADNKIGNAPVIVDTAFTLRANRLKFGTVKCNSGRYFLNYRILRAEVVGVTPREGNQVLIIHRIM